MSTTVWSSTGGTTVTQSLADQAATSATNAASSAAAAATSATEAAASAAAGLAKVSSNDTTAAVLSSKIVGSSTLTVTETNDGSNETLTLATTGLLASASPTVSSGTLTLTSSGLTFSDGTTQTTASSGGGGGGSSLTIADEGSDLSTAATKIDFVGAGVTASGTGATKTITIPGGGSGITVQDEGSALSTLGTTLNFVGSGVTASGSGATKTITISGGGGGGGMSDLSDDSSPSLGGNLDTAGYDIVTTSNANLDLAPNGNGYVVVRGNNNSGKIMLNCESNSHGVSIASPPHSANATYDLVLPTSLSAGALYTSSGGQLSTGVLPVADGGTGASDAAGGRASLGLGTMATAATSDYLALSGGTLTGNLGIEKNGATALTLTRTNSASNYAEIEAAGGNGEQLTIRSNVSNQTGGFTSFDVGGSERMRIAGTGRVGIGTSSPSEQLEVAGKIKTTSGGVEFPDGTLQTSAASAGVSTGKAIALAMIFGG